MYVRFPFCGVEDEFPTFEFSLSKEILSAIDLHVNPKTGKVDDREGISILLKMSSALKELADKIEGSLALNPYDSNIPASQ